MTSQVAQQGASHARLPVCNADVNPNPEILNLERKRKPILAHDIGAGAPCLNCKEACPGLDLHYWRKICRACKCRRDEHDVHDKDGDDPAKIRIGRLFDNISYSSADSNGHLPSAGGGQGDQANGRIQHVGNGSVSGVADRMTQNLHISSSQQQQQSNGHVGNGRAGYANGTGAMATNGRLSNQLALNAQTHPKDTSYVTLSNGRVVSEAAANQQTSPVSAAYKYRWVPNDVNAEIVAEYFSQLPPNDRPIIGTEGEQKRRQALEYQLPLHDCDPNACHALSVVERQTMQKYVDTIKKEVIGMGTVDLIANKEKERKLADPHGIEGCTTCQKRMNKSDVGVFTDHGRPESTWHPNCFRCCVCDERLVDMLYFYNDGQYYCGRHFGDTMYPRCSGCDELIFAKEYTRAEDKDWHLAHFCCFGCDKELGGYRYMVREPHPYCIECYMQKFARTCNTCRGKIGPDTQRIGHKDMNWHATPECFHCETCSESMVSKRFVVKGTHIFCSTDCKQKYFNQQPLRHEKSTAF